MIEILIAVSFYFIVDSNSRQVEFASNEVDIKPLDVWEPALLPLNPKDSSYCDSSDDDSSDDDSTSD